MHLLKNREEGDKKLRMIYAMINIFFYKTFFNFFILYSYYFFFKNKNVRRTKKISTVSLLYPSTEYVKY